MENDVIANTTNCPNCQAEMAITDKFCAECGQKVQRKIPRLGELIVEFFDSVLNIDSKLARTFRAIFIPGQLTILYFKGIRKKYYQPFRLFFLVSVLFFTALGFSGAKKSIMKINENNNLRKVKERVQADKKLTEIKDSVIVKFKDQATVNAVFDSIKTELNVLNADTLKVNLAGSYGNYKIASNDLIALSGDEIIEKYKIDGFWNQFFARQMIKTMQDPSGFTWYMLGNFIWMLIFLMPAVALVLKLLYIRRKRYFVEHLTFLFHFHAFTFFLATIFILVGHYLDNYNIYLALFLGVVVYLFVAMRRFYDQGVMKTFFKFSFLGFSYFILSIIFFVMFSLISLAMF